MPILLRLTVSTLALVLSTACSGASSERGGGATATSARPTAPLAFTTPEAMREVLADFVDRCDPPEAELPFLRVCAKFPSGHTGGQPASVALQAHATREEFRRQAQQARDSFDEPIPDDPADPENDPTYESGVLLGDTWALSVTYNGPVRPILDEAQDLLGGEIVADGKYLEDFDEVLRRLGTDA